MKKEEKLSNSGLKEISADFAKQLKKDYVSEVSSRYNLAPKGYFIGKTLLLKMLVENEDAAGIVISFGLNDAIEKGGKIQLVIEPASGKKATDLPKIINGPTKFATIDDDGPDNLLPIIKPHPPQ
jgi:hypothetical protein